MSITKNCETPIKQTHIRPEETQEFKLTKPKQTFYFTPPIQIEGSWMVGMTSLEFYSSILNITTTNNKNELSTDTFDEFSFEELKDELEEILNISYITPYHLQHELKGPSIIEANKKLRSEKSSTDGYTILLLGYARSPFRDFESYLRIVVDLDEDDVQLILKQYNSNFVTYEPSPRIYSIKDF